MREIIQTMLVEVGLEVALLILAAVAAWALAMLRKAVALFSERTGIVVDEKHRTALEAALKNAVARAEAGLTHERTPEAIIAYIEKFNPDAIRHFGLDRQPEALRTRVDAAVARYTAPHGGGAVDVHVAPGP